MQIFPVMQAKRFEELEPGDLFIFKEGGASSFAMKTEKPSTGDRSQLLVLGPEFPYGQNEAFLLPWQPATVLSFGKDFSVLLPTDPSAWSVNGPSREPVSLAVCDDRAYVCVNGGPSPDRFFQCFVELGTGAIIENRLNGSALFTVSWEIVCHSNKHLPRSILRYPN